MVKGTKKYTFETKNQVNGSKKNENGVDEKKPLPPETTEPDQRSWLQRYAFVITMLLNPMVDGLGMSVSSQFKYSFFHNLYSDELRHFNATRSSVCGEVADVNSQAQEVENKISAESAKWGLYGDFVSVIPMFIASLIIGMKSDQIGRRFLFLLPLISSFFHYILLAVIIRLKLHYGYLLIGSFITACSGGRIGMSLAGYALVSDTHGKQTKPSQPLVTVVTVTIPAEGNSVGEEKTSIQNKDKEKNGDLYHSQESEGDELDVTTEKARTIKIVGLSVATSLASGIFSFATGYMIQYAGYFYCIVIVFVGKVFLFIFAYSFITETGVQKKTTSFMAPLRLIAKAFKDPKKRTTLIFCYLGIFFGIFGFCEEMEIMRTYEMSPPFCLGAVQLGWLSSLRVVKGLFSMPLLWFWKRIYASEATISSIGFVSYAGGAFVLATIRRTWVFFVFPFVTIPGSLSLAISKAIISRLIGRAALASSFAVMLAGEELFWFGGSVASNYMYQKFVYTVPTAPFYAAGASFVVAAMLFAVDPLKQKCSGTDQAADDPEATGTTIKKE